MYLRAIRLFHPVIVQVLVLPCTQLLHPVVVPVMDPAMFPVRHSLPVMNLRQRHRRVHPWYPPGFQLTILPCIHPRCHRTNPVLHPLGYPLLIHPTFHRHFLVFHHPMFQRITRVRYLLQSQVTFQAIHRPNIQARVQASFHPMHRRMCLPCYPAHVPQTFRP